MNQRWDLKAASIEEALENQRHQLNLVRDSKIQHMRAKYLDSTFKGSSTLLDLQRTYDTLMWGKNFAKAIRIKDQLTAQDALERAAWEAKQAKDLKYQLNNIEVKHAQQQQRLDAHAAAQRVELRHLRENEFVNVEQHTQVHDTEVNKLTKPS